MPKSTDTYARAYEACADIFTELARFPTIDLIRERIGVNSPATIKRAITDWTLAFAESQREKLTRPDLPKSLLDGAENLWKLALREADQRHDAERHAVEKERAETAARLSELKAAYDSLQRDFESFRTSAGTALETRDARIRALEESVAAQEEKSSAAEIALRDTQAELDRVIARAEIEQTQFGQRIREWEERFEADHRWHLQRIEEERERAQSMAQRELAERDHRISRLSLENQKLESRLGTSMNQNAELRGRLGAIEESTLALRETLSARENELAEARNGLLDMRHKLALLENPSAASITRSKKPSKRSRPKRDESGSGS